MSVPSLSILVLDDEPSRAECFEHAFFGDEDDEVELVFAHTHSARLCRALLAEQPWDVVFLDHDLDLAQAHFGCFDPGNGTQLVEWLTKLGPAPRWSETLFIVHSINDERGRWMAQELISAGFRTCRRAYAWMDVPELRNLVNLRYWSVLDERWDCSWPVVAPSRTRCVIPREPARPGRAVLSPN